VDEVIEDAPWRIDEAFLNANRIDYVAIDEGASIDPAYDKERVKGYDLVKDLRKLVLVPSCMLAKYTGWEGKAIPTRPTPGLAVLQLAEERRSETPLAAFKNGTTRRKPPMRTPLSDDEKTEDEPFREPLVDFMD
jgi:choline-phosphate cytidylyltransferase